MAAAYQAALSGQGRSYLAGRGLSPEAVDFYRLGEVTAEFPEHASFAGWLCIPYITRAGVVSLKFRNPHPDANTKYISPYETRLYNTMAMDRADRTGVLAVTFGEFDAMVLDFECMIPAVGIPGDQTYSHHPEWRELFRAYDQLLVFPDKDEPNKVTGLKSGEEIAKTLRRDVDTARVIDLPGHDVNKVYLEYGVAEIRRIAGV